MNKQQLANKIWESANKMRSKIEANEYKDYILGFIFYKFLSDKQVRFMQGKGATAEEIAQLSEDDAETVKYIQSNIGYFIAYKDLFSTWLDIGKSFDVSNVRDALSAFDRLIDPNYKKSLTIFLKPCKPGFPSWAKAPARRPKLSATCYNSLKTSPWTVSRITTCWGSFTNTLYLVLLLTQAKKPASFTPHTKCRSL